MVKIDNEEINRLENNDPRSFENVEIYSGDYFNDPAIALYKNLQYESHEGKSLMKSTLSMCYVSIDYCPGCALQTFYESEETLDHMTRGIFVVWWDRKYDRTHEADFLLDTFMAVRKDCLDNLGMFDPPNPDAGQYFNVYIHHDDGILNYLHHHGLSSVDGLPYIVIGRKFNPLDL